MVWAGGQAGRVGLLLCLGLRLVCLQTASVWPGGVGSQEASE